MRNLISNRWRQFVVWIQIGHLWTTKPKTTLLLQRPADLKNRQDEIFVISKLVICTRSSTVFITYKDNKRDYLSTRRKKVMFSSVFWISFEIVTKTCVTDGEHLISNQNVLFSSFIQYTTRQEVEWYLHSFLTSRRKI